MHRYNESKMYTHFSGFCKGAGMNSSLRALGFMREKHGNQRRSNHTERCEVYDLLKN